jgi:hypothetical protein
MDDSYTNDRIDRPSGNMPDDFDRLLGTITGIPGVTSTRESTVTDTPPLGVGGSRTFIVQTYRQRDLNSEKPTPARDTIFLQCIGTNGKSFRIALPAGVADVISRQRDALTDKSRSATAKRLAAERKAAGILPGFMKNKGKRKGKK